MRYIDVMPLDTTYEEFKKYISKIRKEYELKLKWNNIKKSLEINDNIVYFRDYTHCMCYIEGFVKGVEYGSKY